MNGEADKSCEWIGSLESRRLQLCSTEFSVRKRCPTTCGISCEDNSKFSISNEESKTCKWIGETPSKINQYCIIPEVRTNCPQKTTCNMCRTFVEITQGKKSNTHALQRPQTRSVDNI